MAAGELGGPTARLAFLTGLLLPATGDLTGDLATDLVFAAGLAIGLACFADLVVAVFSLAAASAFVLAFFNGLTLLTTGDLADDSVLTRFLASGLAKNLAGDLIGELADGLVGDLTGDLTGDLAGDLAGDLVLLAAAFLAAAAGTLASAITFLVLAGLTFSADLIAFAGLPLGLPLTGVSAVLADLLSPLLSLDAFRAVLAGLPLFFGISLVGVLVASRARKLRNEPG